MSAPDDDELLVTLRQWARELSHTESVESRAQREWHRRLAAEEARFSGALSDLLDQRAVATITTDTSRSHSGAITWVGTDFIAITPDGRPTTLITLVSITSVMTHNTPREIGAPSSRELPEDQTLVQLLTELALEQPRVRFVLGGSDNVQSGALIAAGDDVLTFGLDNPITRTLFVPIEQLREITIADQ